MARPAKKRASPKQREKGLQYRCQQHLEKSGLLGKILIFHVPNERLGGPGAGLHFKRMGVMPGVADYLAFVKNRRIAVELKDGNEPQRPTQETFQKRWEAEGGEYYVVRTLEHFAGIVGAAAVF